MFTKEQIQFVKDADHWAQKCDDQLDRDLHRHYYGNAGWDFVVTDNPSRFAEVLALCLKYKDEIPENWESEL